MKISSKTSAFNAQKIAFNANKKIPVKNAQIPTWISQKIANVLKITNMNKTHPNASKKNSNLHAKMVFFLIFNNKIAKNVTFSAKNAPDLLPTNVFFAKKPNI